MTDEPAWCQPARDRTDDLNRDIRYALTLAAERVALAARQTCACPNCKKFIAGLTLEGDPA